jgi:hypothetical protein
MVAEQWTLGSLVGATLSTEGLAADTQRNAAAPILLSRARHESRTPGRRPVARILRPSMSAEQTDVAERTGGRAWRRLPTRRRLVSALAALAAVLVPVAALGSANDWWFLKFGGTPVPTTAPQVVKEGEWNGHPWQLIAYPSATHGLCISITPKDSRVDGAGGAMSCAPLVGFARTPESGAGPDVAITLLAGAGGKKLPDHIVGAVIEEASVVEVRFGDGDVLRVPTFAGPEPLQHVRFYAAQLPTAMRLAPGTFAEFAEFLEWVAGLDANGTVVACSATRTADDGSSPLSDCR